MILTWAQGAILVLLGLIVVAVAAQIVDEDRRERRKRRDVRRAKQAATGRARMATDLRLTDEYRQRLSDAADVIERNGWRAPDAERLP